MRPYQNNDFGQEFYLQIRLTLSLQPMAVIKVLFTGYNPNTSTVQDPQIRYSSPRGHLISNKPTFLSSTASKRPITGKSSQPANTNKTKITELPVTTPNVNKGILFQYSNKNKNTLVLTQCMHIVFAHLSVNRVI